MDKLLGLVSERSYLEVAACLTIIAWALSKIIPKAWIAFNTARNKVNYGEDLVNKTNQNKSDIEHIYDILAKDYRSLNEIKSIQEKQNRVERESLEEREIIMRSLLAVLKGLQELGTNGPTKDAQSEIELYINKQAHRYEDAE